MKKNKKKMVISGKRKRRDSPIIDSSPELPKRTKVQAQRKFAQGQSAPSSAAYSSVIASSSSAIASNNNSQPGTPIRENREPPPELITHKRPRTEDFLTFLCFRGSSVLPSHLDFLNQNKNPTTGRTEENDSSSITPTATEVVNNESEENGNSSNVAKASTSKEKNANNATKIDTSKDKNQAVEETITDDTKAQKSSSDVMLFAVRKRADQVCKTATKVKRKNKDTNRRSLRTRGKAVNATQASKIDLQKNEKDCDEENIKEEAEETPSIKTLGGKSSENNVIETKQTKRKTTAASLKAAKSANTKENKTNESKKNLEITPNLKSTSETEDDRKTPSEKAKPATTKGKPKSRATSPPLIPSPQPGGRMTRRRAFFEPVKPPSRADEDKTQENTKKLPEKTDFSSDDEQPLATAIKTTKRAGRSPKKTGRGKKKGDANSNSTSEVKQTLTSISPSPARKRNKTASAKSNERLSPVIKQQEIEEKSSERAVSEKSNKNYKKSRKREIEIRAGSISRKSDTSSKVSSSKQTRKTANTNKKLVNTLKLASTPAIDKESINSSPKRKTKKSFDPNFSQKSHSQTDLSENENRAASRPTRKTKEAATIYMELIGQKLNLDDFDDDDSSIDSFPELPNAKKTQKMENELKKNANTTKSGKQTKTRGAGVMGKTKEKDTVAKNYVAAASAKNIAVAADTIETSSKSSLKQKEFSSIDEKSINTSTTTTEMKKLEKSFSDSDDEPLATKVINKPNDQDETTVNDAKEFDAMNVPHKKSSLTGKINEPLCTSVNLQQHRKNSNTFNIINEPKPIVFEKEKKPEKISIETSKGDEKNEKIQKQPTTKLKNASPSKQQQSQLQYQQINKQATVTTAVIPKIENISSPKPQPPLPSMLSPTTSAAATSFPVLDRYPSPKVNPSFLTPKFDRNLADRHHRAAVAASITDFSGSSSIVFPSTSYIPKVSGMSSPASKSAAAVAAATAMVEMSSTTPKASPSPQNSTQSKKLEPSASTSAASIDNILAANLMPSKEESGKIFGIASVSLAQSSGPDNTKCTLGKCGSIHKPVLGPVVPTESYLGDQLSGKERRKAKVNMTHEQIQKWLIECSSNPDEIQDDLDDDFDLPLKPMTFPPSPSPPLRSGGCGGGGFGSDEKESTSQSSSSKATKDNVKSESAWSCKGPSLKAVPVMKEESRSSSLQNDNDKADNSYDIPPIPVVSSSKSKQQQQKSEQKQQKVKETPSTDVSLLADKVSQKAGKQSSSTATATAQNNKTPVAENFKSSPVKPSTSSKTPTPITSPTATTTTPKQQKRGASNSPTKSQKTTSQQNKQQKSSPTTTSSPKKTSSPAATSTEQKKATPSSTAKNVKRQPVYNTKLSEPASKRKSLLTTKNSFSAFSAENETSVYSFDKEDDVPPPVAKPFRRHSRRESHYEDNSQATAEKSATPKTVDNEKLKEKEGTTGAKDFSKDVQQNSSVSVTLSPEENSKLVKVSLDAVENPTKATSNTTSEKAQVNEFSGLGDSDSEGHTYYIPLQGIGQTSSADGKSDLIQGVAVKLGREGPEGPNQRVIMHATLVTKAQMGANTTPLPESMNVHEIVKNLLSSSSSNNKESTVAAAAPATTSKSVPIGTVQPRFKSTSVNTNPDTQQNPSGSGLSRVNSNSSLFSGSNKSRTTSAGPKIKVKDDTPIKMCNNTAFPRHDDPSQMVEAPIFRPTEKEFSDPIEFIERITPIAARFGICKIIPPASFKPECRVSDDMRFTAYNQYVHKMLHRWGPSAKELSAIKKYLATQSIAMTHPPWIGGMEVDLPRLYHTVQELGGLKEVIEKKKWARVAEEMCIPKLAQDRVTKLDDIYCKYLLPYDTLSPAERQKLFDEVEADWAKREARARRNADRCVNLESVSNEDDGASSEDEEESEDELDGVSMECIVKGKSMPLNQFFRIARNTMAVWFKNTEPTVTDIEAEFWRHVAVRDSHVCVHSGSIDSSGWGYGFPTPGPKGKGSACAKHPWNLKVLTNNQGSVLRSLGPVMGVTVPTLHVGMLFSACCWYRDPHGLSWIEYLHTGASKIWYGIPDEQSSNFRSALTALIPTHCQNKTIWLPCDTVMVPPHMLTDRGVSLCRTEQKPGEFVVIFPRAYTSSVSTGYVVSESVYFATSSWLSSAKDDFKDIHDSCEPAMFSLEQLLFAIASDQRVTNDILTQILPMMQEVYEKEVAARQQLKAGGCTSTEKLEQNVPSTGKSKQKIQKIHEEHECDLCRANLYISMVKTDEGNVYCLQHALKNINNGNVPPKQCKLIFTYNIEDIENLIKKINERLIQKKPISGSSNTKKIK